MIKATFTPQNRMVYLELSFDVMSFMQQLRRASGKQDFQVSTSLHYPVPIHRLHYLSYSLCKLIRTLTRITSCHLPSMARPHFTNPHLFFTNSIITSFISLPPIYLFQVVPNTVSIAKEDACEARVITEATHPYRITYASQVRPLPMT